MSTRLDLSKLSVMDALDLAKLIEMEAYRRYKMFAAQLGRGGGHLIFWKTDAVKELHKLKLPDTARDMDLHADGLRLATAHYNRSLVISSMTPKPVPAKAKPKPKK